MQSLNWKNAILAGIAGTILFDLFGLIAPGQWWDLPALLGERTGLGLAYGVFGHYANGILIAILYVAMAPHLWGPYWFRALLFMTAETIALVWFFMLPMLGAGVAGINESPMMAVITLVRHWIYAIALIFIANRDFKLGINSTP